MAKKKSKKVVVTKQKQKLKPTASKFKSGIKKKPEVALAFGKSNYMLMLLGIFLIILGLILMSGGKMPSPDVWDESLIYSFRRITLAPMIIIAGLIVELFAIFRK